MNWDRKAVATDWIFVKEKETLPNPYRVNTTIPYSSTLLYLEGIWDGIYEIIGWDDNNVILFITIWSEPHKRKLHSLLPLLSCLPFTKYRYWSQLWALSKSKQGPQSETLALTLDFFHSPKTEIFNILCLNHLSHSIFAYQLQVVPVCMLGSNTSSSTNS